MNDVLLKRKCGHKHRGKTIRIHKEKAAMCKPSRKASDKINPANTLVSDFWSPELRENKFILLKPSRLSYFVMAAVMAANNSV